MTMKSTSPEELEKEPEAAVSGEVLETTPATKVEKSPSLPQWKVFSIMVALSATIFLVTLDAALITTALPAISRSISSASGYTWIGNVYFLANASTAPLWGSLSDIWGRKPVLLLSTLIFLGGSLLAALSRTVAMMVSARAAQGVGGGGITVLVNVVVSDLFDLQSRGIYLGIIAVVSAIATPLGPLIGGAFANKVSWRWNFFINLPIGVIAILLLILSLRHERVHKSLKEGLKMIDWFGAITIAGGTVMVLLGLNYGGAEKPWNSSTVICLIVFGVLTWMLYILNEWKFARRPFTPLWLFNSWSNVAAFVICFAHASTMMGGPYYLSLYFQTALGASPLRSGLYLLPSMISVSITGGLAGFLIAATKSYTWVLWLGTALTTLGYGLYINLGTEFSLVKIIMYQTIASAGVGLNFQTPLIALQAGTQQKDVASASATFAFIRQLASSIAITIGGAIFQNQIQSQHGKIEAAVGSEAAKGLNGFSIAEHTEFVLGLPREQRVVVQQAVVDSLRVVWIVYAAFSGVGLFSTVFIQRRGLKGGRG